MHVRSTPRHSDARLAFRLPAALAEDLRAIAARDHNGVSATARRLLSAAIVRERNEGGR